MTDFIAVNIQRYRKYAREFERVFGCKLKPYFNNITGFDVVKFDEEFVQAPDGRSTAEVVEKKWGPDAVKLIRSLIGDPEPVEK